MNRPVQPRVPSSRFRPAFATAAVLIALFVGATARANTTLTSEGSSPIVGDNRVRARQRAVDEATKQAVEQASRQLLSGVAGGPLMPDQEAALRRDVLPRARTFVRSFRILSETEEPIPAEPSAPSGMGSTFGGAPPSSPGRMPPTPVASGGMRYRVQLEAEVDDVALGAQLRRPASAAPSGPIVPGQPPPLATKGGAPYIAVATLGGSPAVASALEQAALRGLLARGIPARLVPLRAMSTGRMDEAAARAAASGGAPSSSALSGSAAGSTSPDGAASAVGPDDVTAPPGWPTDTELTAWLVPSTAAPRPSSAAGALLGGLLIRVDQLHTYPLRATTQWGAEALVRVKLVPAQRGDGADGAGTEARYAADRLSASSLATVGALETALGRMGEPLSRMGRSQPDTGGELEITLTGAFTFADYQRLSQRLVAMAGEPSVEPRRFERGSAQLAVRSSLDAATVARRLTQSAGQPLGNELTAEPSGPRSVRVRVNPRPAAIDSTVAP